MRGMLKRGLQKFPVIVPGSRAWSSSYGLSADHSSYDGGWSLSRSWSSSYLFSPYIFRYWSDAWRENRVGTKKGRYV